MKTLGNIIWFLFGGLEFAIAFFLLGIIYCITIIGIPLGLQMFKIAGFVIWPFGKVVVDINTNGFKVFLNVLWLVFGGIFTVAMIYLVGVIFCITIIGIPFGKQYFKLGSFLFKPLGHGFEKAENVQAA